MENIDRKFGISELLEEEALSQVVRSDAQTAKAVLELNGLDFRGERYFMAIFREKYYEDMYFLSDINGPMRDNRYKMDMSKELMKSCCESMGKLYFLRRPGSVAGIIEVRGEPSEKDIRRMVEELLRMIKQKTGLNPKTMISSMHEGLGELAACFEEAEKLVRYCDIAGIEKQIVFFSEYTFSPFPNPIILAKSVEMRLFSSVRSGDYISAAQLLEGMIRDSFFNVTSSIYVIEYKFAHMKSLALSLLADISLKVSVDFLEDINAMRRILDASSAQKLIDEINGIFSELTEFSKTVMKQFPPLWLRDVAKYIDDNFADPLLNISSIAEHFELSADYISREFKTYRGVSILEYIHTLRLAAARRLLAAGGMNVHDVAQKVGYGHERTMTRAFKKYEGITPGMLRG